MAHTNRQIAGEMSEALGPRFWSKVDINGPNGCWVWLGYVEKSGYGKFRFNGETQRCHRVTYECFVGKIPKGKQIDHLCRNRACCNPEHLEAVTPKINNFRGLNQSLKLTCVNGHPWLPENIYTAATKTGVRKNCRICILARQARSYEANPTPVRERASKWWAQHKDEVNRKRREQRLEVKR